MKSFLRRKSPPPKDWEKEPELAEQEESQPSLGIDQNAPQNSPSPEGNQDVIEVPRVQLQAWLEEVRSLKRLVSDRGAPPSRSPDG